MREPFSGVLDIVHPTTQANGENYGFVDERGEENQIENEERDVEQWRDIVTLVILTLRRKQKVDDGTYVQPQTGGRNFYYYRRATMSQSSL